jgi:hypothetical protein
VGFLDSASAKQTQSVNAAAQFAPILEKVVAAMTIRIKLSSFIRQCNSSDLGAGFYRRLSTRISPSGARKLLPRHTVRLISADANHVEASAPDLDFVGSSYGAND